MDGIHATARAKNPEQTRTNSDLLKFSKHAETSSAHVECFCRAASTPANIVVARSASAESSERFPVSMRVVAAAVETYKGAAYAAALAALGDGAERDLRIVEMVA